MRCFLPHSHPLPPGPSRLATFLTTILLAFMVALGSGCAVVVEGAAGSASAVVYERGELKAREYASYDQVWNAAMFTMSDLGYAVTRLKKDVIEAKITARAPSDKKIQIEVFKVTGMVTEFHIRFGRKGDNAKSKQIYEAIKKRLSART